MNTKTTTQTDTLTQTKGTLVLGGNGKTGRRIVDRLESKGLPVQIGSRSGSPSFDWHESSNWDAVLEDVQAIYIAYYPDLAVPGASDHIRELVAKAKQHGVGRIVLLSGRGEEEAQLCERIVMNSGIPATVVRCAWFNQNLTESFMHEMVMAGTIALPIHGVKEPFVDAEDIADVSFVALTEDGHAGKIYEMTGPRLIAFEEIAEEISNATGRPIQFVPISNDEFVDGLREAQLPDVMVKLLDYLFKVGLDGRNECLGDGVQQALGRPPRDFKDFVAEAKASGAWN
ncbi:MAG: NmrA family NAD(P)-binding protein [Verrucomicrobiota bacterium]